MKLPKLPAECIRRLITTKTQERFPLEITRETILAMVLGFCDPGKYTIEELDKLGILNILISTSIHIYNNYNLTKETLELFDEIKSNPEALNHFILQINLLGQNLLKAPGVKQYILDTLIGPEWKESDFYLCRDFGLEPFFGQDLMCKKDIGNILCNGLCIFDDIPEDRLNKFYDALRRLKPYIKRRGFYYTIANSARISYKEEDFPISMSELIKQHTDMYLERCIENNQLIIRREFRISGFFRHVPRKELTDFLNRLKEKYPNILGKNFKLPRRYVQWKNTQEYNIPTDLKELTNT